MGIQNKYYVGNETVTSKVNFVLLPLKDDGFNKHTYLRVRHIAFINNLPETIQSAANSSRN